MFIAIEGLDGSGKSTQINLLIEKFQNDGRETRFVHFPRLNEGVYGDMIAKFLRGEFGAVSDVHPQLVALLFAEDRKQFAATIREWLDADCVVLVDRYVLSNIAFQCAKTKNLKEKELLREWINHFEYDFRPIPRPDLSFYLEVPFEFTDKSLNSARLGEHREYLNGKDDIHEKDIDLQLAVKKEYEHLLEIDPAIVSIVCSDENNKMLSIEKVHLMIVEQLESRLTQKADRIF